ncbi:DUF2799 domain-containing protein [Thaumasiovibrio subtropicus]|uniref:DUF2799 domain-containing protein n=1 Tax=Thaumasiovibrio subtropicus TaxID=1891207 RepID=UPI000B35A302|nr:DUF2799 domain-containing protein [Thaumasiovibrio subtropicus]
MKTKLLWLLAPIALVGCQSTYVAEYANNEQWYQLGEEDALRGLHVRNASMNEEALSLYEEGYAIGKAQYCESSNAWMLGRIGKPYLGICHDLPHGWSFQLDYDAGRERWRKW